MLNKNKKNYFQNNSRHVQHNSALDGIQRIFFVSFFVRNGQHGSINIEYIGEQYIY